MKIKGLLSSLAMAAALWTPAAVSIAIPLAAYSADKPVSDDYIHDQVMIKLAGDPVAKGGAMDVSVKDGVVTLNGTVQAKNQKDKAERVAHKVKGVKSVVNQLKVVHAQ